MLSIHCANTAFVYGELQTSIYYTHSEMSFNVRPVWSVENDTEDSRLQFDSEF